MSPKSLTARISFFKFDHFLLSLSVCLSVCLSVSLSSKNIRSMKSVPETDAVILASNWLPLLLLLHSIFLEKSLPLSRITEMSGGFSANFSTQLQKKLPRFARLLAQQRLWGSNHWRDYCTPTFILIHSCRNDRRCCSPALLPSGRCPVRYRWNGAKSGTSHPWVVSVCVYRQTSERQVSAVSTPIFDTKYLLE